MKTQRQKNSKILELIKKNIKDNLKEYLIVSIIFILGIIISIIVINHLNEEQRMEIQTNLTDFIYNLNMNSKIDQISLIKESILSNLALGISLWFIGSTIIGIPVVCLIIGMQGFLLGYTISSIMITFNSIKGILMTLICLLIQNILFIPAIIAIGVSGIKFYKAIAEDKRKEKIKIEVLRHTIFSLIMCMLLIASSCLETYISSNLLMFSAKFFA